MTAQLKFMEIFEGRKSGVGIEMKNTFWTVVALCAFIGRWFKPSWPMVRSDAA